MDLLFPLLIVFMIGMIFFSNRQRKKQQRQQENLQSSISVGDVVVMTCGVSGTVVDTDDEKTIDLEIAPEVITTWLRAAVREKLSSDADTAHTDGHPLHTDGALESATPTNGATVSTASTHGTPTNGTGSPTAGSTTEAPTASSADGGFSDPTAAPSGDGVSAGSSTPGDTRSSS